MLRLLRILFFIPFFVSQASVYAVGLLDLPNEILAKIAGYTDNQRDVLNIALTCTQLREVPYLTPLTVAIYGPHYEGLLPKAYVDGALVNIYIPHESSNLSPAEKLSSILCYLSKIISDYTVRSIYLSAEFISARNINTFAQIVYQCTHLERLVLDHNDILNRSLGHDLDDNERDIKNALNNLGKTIRKRNLITLALTEKDPGSLLEGETRYLGYLGEAFSPSLEHLELAGADEGLPKSVHKLTRLKTLRLPFCALNQDEMITMLPQMTNLKSLDLSNNCADFNLGDLLNVLPSSLKQLDLQGNRWNVKTLPKNLNNLELIRLSLTIYKHQDSMPSWLEKLCNTTCTLNVSGQSDYIENFLKGLNIKPPVIKLFKRY